MVRAKIRWAAWVTLPARRDPSLTMRPQPRPSSQDPPRPASIAGGNSRGEWGGPVGPSRSQVRTMSASLAAPPAVPGNRRSRRTRATGGCCRPAAPPGQPAPPGAPGWPATASVVELAGQEHLVGAPLQLGEQLLGVRHPGQRCPELRLAEDRPQRPGQVTLGQLAGRAWAARASCAASASSTLVAGSSRAGRGQLERHRAAPDQGRVQGGAGRLQPGVQPVQPARPPGHVHARNMASDDDDR